MNMVLLCLNLLIAILWLGLSSHPDPMVFIIGFIMGAILIELFHPIFSTHHTRYTKRLASFLWFHIIFIKELLISNIEIARCVLFGRIDAMEPGILEYDIADLNNFEILLLSHAITLTPGTTSIGLSDDKETLYIHAFDARDPNAVRDSITSGLRAPIMRFTR